ncbi:MAG: hypothetical protein FWC60_00915, partial [Firmicutes bacterium]|nr:hypothetical protein [Bacillota bacterium]
MKTKFYGIIAVIAAIGLLFAACSNPSGGDTGTQNPPPIVKSVSVGAQSGTMTAGAAGSVSYHVTTTNIADGSYTVSVNNLPADLSVSGKVTISGGEGLLTLAGSVSTTARTISNLSLTIDGTTSAVFSLTIAAPDTPSVSVGKQSGTLTAGVAGTVTFTITTAKIAANTYTAAVANLPAGVTVSGSVVIASNTGTLTLAGDNLTAAGTTSKLTLTINGTTSAAFAITIIPHPDDGTQAYPFKVTTAADLQKVGTETTSGGWTLSAYYKQTTNIDLSGIANWTPIGSGLSFIGTYDGGGFTISNLKVSHTGG